MKTKPGKAFAAIARVAPTKRGAANDDLKYVQDYLVRFGYLAQDSYVVGELDEATSSALQSFQRMSGKRTTGEFNQATRDQMTQYRCAHADMGLSVEANPQCAWDRNFLTFAFDIGTADVPGVAEFDAVRNAMRTWAAVVPMTFVEVALDQNPDIRIGWRPAADPDRSMVGGTLAHADFPPDCSVVTDTLPKPVHFDDEEVFWSIGAVPGAFDVETLALHELGHIMGLGHSDAGTVMQPFFSPNFVQRALTPDDIAGIRALYPEGASIPVTVPRGVYTIQQRSNGRFVDAHEHSGRDFGLVTREFQNNRTQKWVFTPLGGIYTIQQKSNWRFVDAHEYAGKDFGLVTREAQNNDTQKWILTHLGNNEYTIQQLSNGRFVDAHDPEANRDFAVVTREAQNNDTQRWILKSLGGNTFTLQQKSSGRFMDAHEIEERDFALVTRDAQNNNTQRWILTPVATFCTIQQLSNGRFVDAHDPEANRDFAVVTREAQNNDTQRWILKSLGGNTFTLQQKSSGRFMDAHEIEERDFALVTRPFQDNDTQRWEILVP
jgi:hypothetical protein